MKALIFAAALVAMPAYAQENCGRHDDVLNTLATLFGETVQVQAIQNNMTLLEITANPETGSWTILITDASGMTCGVAGGGGFEVVKPGQPA